MTAALTAALIAAVVDGAGIAGTLTYAAIRAGATLTPTAPTAPPQWTPPAASPVPHPDRAATYRQMAEQPTRAGRHRHDLLEEPTRPDLDAAAIVAAAEARRAQIQEQQALAPVPVETTRFRPQVAESLLGLDADADTRPAYTPAGDWAQTGGAA